MKSIWVSIQLAFSALGGFLGWYLGGVDGFLYALIAFVLVDYITGVMCAIADKKLSSAVGFKGICRKVLIFVLVGIGNLVDVYVLGEGGALRTAVIFFYLSNEGISFLENAGHLGLPIPEKLKDVLEQLHDKGGNDNESAETEFHQQRLLQGGAPNHPQGHHGTLHRRQQPLAQTLRGTG